MFSLFHANGNRNFGVKSSKLTAIGKTPSQDDIFREVKKKTKFCFFYVQLHIYLFECKIMVLMLVYLLQICAYEMSNCTLCQLSLVLVEFQEAL